MPRPCKRRRICELPKCNIFLPKNAPKEDNIVIMHIDEYECIRLIDYEGMTQEECAKNMNLVRTSIQLIYSEARKKLSDCIVNGKGLKIEGGNYILCEGNLDCCKMRLTSGNRCLGRMNKEWRMKKMIIAVTYKDGEVFQHFGHCENFKIYSVEDGKITEEKIINTNGNGHGALAGFLKNNSVDVLICGGIGMGARNALAEKNIELYPGVVGNSDEAVKALLEDKLSYNPNTVCSHHHGEHSCGDKTSCH